MANEQSLFGDVSVSLDHVADVTIRISGKHTYLNISGIKPWQIAIYWDGMLINYAGGAGAYTDAPFCEGAVLAASLGSHMLRITWFGDNSIVLRGVNAVIEWSYK